MIRAHIGALKTADSVGKLHATCACYEHVIITLIPEFRQPTIPVQTRHSSRNTHAHTLPSQACMIRAHIGALKTSDSVGKFHATCACHYFTIYHINRISNKRGEINDLYIISSFQASRIIL